MITGFVIGGRNETGSIRPLPLMLKLIKSGLDLESFESLSTWLIAHRSDPTAAVVNRFGARRTY